MLPTSSFTLLSPPQVNRHTGAITFLVSMSDPGSFRWRLILEKRVLATRLSNSAGCARGGCKKWRAVVFGQGSTTAPAGAAVVVVTPSSAAAAALAAQARLGRGLQVEAVLSFQSSLGAGPFSRTSTIAVKLARASRKR